MTAEQLHDAIGLLPADLVAQADAARQQKRKQPWKKAAIFAACFCLVAATALTFGKAPVEEAADEAAPREPMLSMAAPATGTLEKRQENGLSLPGVWCVQAQPENAQADMAPKAVLVSRMEELEDCRNQWAGFYGQGVLQEAFSGYDEAWFAQRQLYLLPVDAGQSLSTEQMELTENGWELTLRGNPGTTHWLVLVELETGSLTESSQVIIHWKAE